MAQRSAVIIVSEREYREMSDTKFAPISVAQKETSFRDFAGVRISSRRFRNPRNSNPFIIRKDGCEAGMCLALLF
jgi:hypothetical protein